MPPDIKSHPLNNLSLKILALVFGYTLWKSMSDIHKIKISMRAPISFYNEQGFALDAPESVAITLFAKRDIIYQLTRDLAVHIDAKNFKTGKNTIALNEKFLLLPDTVKLVNCQPNTVTISVEKV